jgi:hypothetical protein
MRFEPSEWSGQWMLFGGCEEVAWITQRIALDVSELEED